MVLFDFFRDFSSLAITILLRLLRCGRGPGIVEEDAAIATTLVLRPATAAVGWLSSSAARCAT